jgi:tRNA-splicing ligase RtcB (3'-phosphate/5'-hydroxy nucleic acid ligase)
MTKLENNIEIHKWLVDPLNQEVSKAVKRISQSEGVRFIAVMPDVHLSGEVCIGTVVATDSLIYPQAVGNDIGCGMTTVSFDCHARELLNETRAAKIIGELYLRVPSNLLSHFGKREGLPDGLLMSPLSHEKLEKAKSRDGLAQFGTLGRGNHFLEFQADEEDRLWATVHSGSRGMGKMIVDHHLRMASTGERGLKFFDANDDAGQAYLNDHDWARAYAEGNRLEMMEKVIEMLERLWGIESCKDSQFSCDHNHVFSETHFGESLYVHRKGSLSAHEGKMGVIPGSMGTDTFHTRGRGCPKSLCSSSHGAGRVMSRTEARKNITVKSFYKQMEGIWFDHRKSRGLVDEAPSAYKNINAVMRAQKELTKIARRLKPILNYKGI